MNTTTKSSGNGSQACASCKYQRRKCNSDCLLAPYFRPDQQKQFLNAHRLFGVSNILKILKSLHPSQHPEAMKTIIFQSNMRSKDPVRGCYGVIKDTRKEIERLKAELLITLEHLNNVKQQLQIQGNVNNAVGIDAQFYGVPLNQNQHVVGGVNPTVWTADVGDMHGGGGFPGGSWATWLPEYSLHPATDSPNCDSKPEFSGSVNMESSFSDCDHLKHFINLFEDRDASFLVTSKDQTVLECR